ncbi:phage tail family protein, partial [Lactococcus lactis]
MTFTVKFGNNFLTDYMRIIEVHRNLGAGIESTTEDKISGGANFIRSRRNKSTIEVEFRTFWKDDIANTRRKLAEITSTEVPLELIFSDEPNIYYQAIRSGEVTLTENKSKLFATGTLTFLVPKGYAESVDTKVLNNDNSGGENGTIINNADHSVSVLINNNGTLPIYPTIKVTPTSETGYLAFVGQNGILEIGNPDEADTTTAKSQKLV